MSIEDTDAYLNMAENFEAVWQDALKVLRCVECARALFQAWDG